jgi:hypothetical protein
LEDIIRLHVYIRLTREDIHCPEVLAWGPLSLSKHFIHFGSIHPAPVSPPWGYI